LILLVSLSFDCFLEWCSCLPDICRLLFNRSPEGSTDHYSELLPEHDTRRVSLRAGLIAHAECPTHSTGSSD